MALSADKVRQLRDRHFVAFDVTNALVLYKGSYVGFSTSTGYVVKWADTANYQWLGIVQRGVTGDTTAAENLVEVDCSGAVEQGVSVTGTSAITNVGDLVYASDDNTLTTSAVHGSNVDPIAWVTRWYSSTTCDVMFFTPSEHRCTPA